MTAGSVPLPHAHTLEQFESSHVMAMKYADVISLKETKDSIRRLSDNLFASHVTSAVEHSSVLNYCIALERKGTGLPYLPVDREGLFNLADFDAAITDETAVISGPTMRRGCFFQ